MDISAAAYYLRVVLNTVVVEGTPTFGLYCSDYTVAAFNFF